MARTSRTRRRFMARFDFDMALRDSRKKRGPVFSEMTPEQRRAWADEQARKAIARADAARLKLPKIGE